ncbi:MAG TPA: serine/threonine-protein kinase [Verrucomicrobiota bacterium]|nr:serine/threonine-protein kinase [Verrucomicrobiota bacterium]
MTHRTASHCCPKCGTPIPAEASQGLCPKCALAAVAAATETGEDGWKRAAPPSLETVAAAFPQLEILELIGVGGMGAVFKARQSRLDRMVALKLLVPPLAAPPTFAERFNREARVLARLNHPGIVSVYDYGEAGGFFYLLMEFVDGVNLRQAMRTGRFTPIQAMALVPKICEALQFAHDEGILHRDIKPENILLDTRGRVKIADFGIAKLIGDKAKDATLTGSGLAVGTPHYMAPEQLEHPQDVDHRADIYSLGVVFYEMLTGELPLGRFAPPSQKTPLDPRVDEVVLRALERERDRRQSNANEVKEQVETITLTPIPGGPAKPDSESQPVSNFEPKVSLCSISTPEYLRTFRGRFLYIYQARGELRLHREALAFQSGWQAVSIPLTSIRRLSRGDYPASAKPVPLGYFGITYEEHGSLRTLLFTPTQGGLAPPWEVNPLVAEWISAVQEAVRQVTGCTLKVETSNAAENWSGTELVKTFLLSAAGCTVAFSIIPLITARRLTNRPEEFLWGPLTAALTLGILLAARWSRRRMGILSMRQTSLRAWEREWLRIPAPARQILRTAFALAALVLVVLFLSFSYSEQTQQNRVFLEWSVGAFDPWLLRSLHDPGSGLRGVIALNVATLSFACGVGSLLLGALALTAFRIEAIGRGLPPGAQSEENHRIGIVPNPPACPEPEHQENPRVLENRSVIGNSEPSAPCFFSTPERMRDCFPGPQAHIFQCKGELRLGGGKLVFVSPWQTRVEIPLKDIHNLSIGQFQLWTTPWVMKYARVNFLALTFAAAAQRHTIHLTPMPSTVSATASINAEVALWFERIREAVAFVTGNAPPSSSPEAVSVSAQSGWNRRAMPVLLAFVASYALLIWRSLGLNQRGMDALSAMAMIAMILLGIGLGWYSLGFLRANGALKRGDLDAVTSDEPPQTPTGSGVLHTRTSEGAAGVSWKAVASAVCSIPSWLIVIGLLTKLHDSLGPDGLPPRGFNIGLYELLVLGTGGWVGLGAMALGSQALSEIRASTGRLRGARLAVAGLLGIPTGLVLKFLPPMMASLVHGYGWQPSVRQGEIFTGAVLLGIFTLVVWVAWVLWRWAKGAPMRPRASMA